MAGQRTPTVYCHGNPSHGEGWLPFLERGGPAIAIDMPGWGHSDRPDRPLGELANATTTRSSMALPMRLAHGDRAPMSPEFLDMVWSHWDKGTRDATLALYRPTPIGSPGPGRTWPASPAPPWSSVN